MLGTDYRPATRIYLTSPPDSSGTVNGDLWIRGGGDPSLGSRYYNASGAEDSFLDEWADTLTKLGVKRINGRVIADASEFGYMGVPDGWSWSDMGNYYGAGPSGLVIYDNMTRYIFRTEKKAGEPALFIQTFPHTPGLRFHNYIVSGGHGDNSYIYGAPYSLDRFGTGYLQLGEPWFVVKGSLPDPEFQFAYDFRKKLIGKGVIVSDSAITARDLPPLAASLRYADLRPVYTNYGRDLGTLIWWTNMRSVNLFAEELLCLSGYVKSGKGTTENGLETMERFWKGKIPFSGMFIKDGSGLSRSNAISPRHFTNLLIYMTKSKNWETWFNCLPIAGQSGTLSDLCSRQPGDGRIHAKSGTMNRIKSYCGYVETQSGKRVAFAFILNNFDCSSSAAVERMETVLNGIAGL